MHKAEPYATLARVRAATVKGGEESSEANTDARQGAKTQRRTVLSSWRALRLSERIAFLHGFPGCGCLLVFPTDDVGIDPFAAGLAIGTEADNLGFVGLMFAGEAVDEVTGPGILGNVLGHVGAVPLVDIGGLDAQGLQALLGGGEGAGIELVGAQGGHEIIDLGTGDGDFRLIRPPEQRGSDEGHEEPDDGYHHQHFDEGDTGLTGAVSIAFRSLSHGYIATSLMLVIASSMLRIRAPIRMPITRMTTGSKMAVKRRMEARVSVS